MKAADQLTMFEPEGPELARLVAVHSRNAEFETRKAANLFMAGYQSAGDASLSAAGVLFERAAVCETALQFERLGGCA